MLRSIAYKLGTNCFKNTYRYGYATSNTSFRNDSISPDEVLNKHSQTFGFEAVKEDEKVEKVQEVFSRVSSKYDVMNDAMSMGIHRIWKNYLIEKIAPLPGMALLDVAGGTGDVAERFLKSANSRMGRLYPDDKLAEATVYDLNQNMLDVGKEKLKHISGLHWVHGDAENLPFEDNTFDVYTISFGLRNVTHIEKAIKEAHRVLKVGGRYYCLEFSRVQNPVLRSMYDCYSFQVIPVLGKIIAGDSASYKYLVESIRMFPPQEQLAQVIRDAGFFCVEVDNLLDGVAAIHSGIKLEPMKSV